jgi:MraZ protein
MRNFRSQFTNRIDAKGRISVPASFRAVIAEGAWAGVCCLRSLTDRAIDGYSQTRLDEFTEMIEEHDPMSQEYRHLNLALNGGTWELPFDQDGRIILPEELLHHARITEQATFVGLGKYFQIWEPETFATRLERAIAAVEADPGLLHRRAQRAEERQ